MIASGDALAAVLSAAAVPGSSACDGLSDFLDSPTGRASGP
jgi:hypothetical protein